MLKKEILLDSRQLSAARISFPQYRALRRQVVRFLVATAGFYSRLSGLRITPRRAFHLLHGQAGAFVALLPLPMSPLFRLLAYAWVVLAVFSCFSRK